MQKVLSQFVPQLSGEMEHLTGQNTFDFEADPDQVYCEFWFIFSCDSCASSLTCALWLPGSKSLHNNRNSTGGAQKCKHGCKLIYFFKISKYFILQGITLKERKGEKRKVSLTPRLSWYLYSHYSERYRCKLTCLVSVLPVPLWLGCIFTVVSISKSDPGWLCSSTSIIRMAKLLNKYTAWYCMALCRAIN